MFRSQSTHSSYFLRKLNASLQLLGRVITVFHNQDDPKACLPCHHLGVGSSCLTEWDGFDHRRHPTQGTEAKRCVSRGWVSRQRACYFAFSEYEIHAGDLNRLGANSEVNGDTAGSKAPEGRRDCLASRSRYDNDLGAAKRQQSRCGVGSSTVNVVVSAELLGQLRCVAPAGNRRHLKPHMPGVLHGQMTKAADTQHSHKITRLCRCVS